VVASLGFIALVTAVNLVGVHWASRFQVLTVVLKLLPLLLVAILAAGLLLAQGSAALHPFPAEGFMPRSVAQAAAIAMFALLGFESVTCMTDRIRDPERTLPRALIGGVLFVGFIYLAVSSALVLMVPEAELSVSSAPFADFVATHWAAAPAAFITLFVVISCVGTMNGLSMANGELPRAMARRGMVSGWFGRLNANGTPSRGVLASSLVASALVLTTTSDTLGGIFTTMALLTTALALWGYLALAVVALKFRLAVPAAVISLGFVLWIFTGIGLKIALLSLALLIVGLPLYRRAKTSAAPAPAE
jgi:APA family basic amino acid/polyamine antiporter